MCFCSICNQTVVGILHDSTYATQCGHIFHYQCLSIWLERSKTCPHCHSSVIEDKLVRLFLDKDPAARVIWDRKTDEEINTLKEQIKNLKKKETLSSNTINCLETELRNKKSVLNSANARVDLSKKELENHEKINSELFSQLNLWTAKCNKSEIDRKKTQTTYSLMDSKIKSLNSKLNDLQSINSSIVDELKFEIADLKSEKEYFLRRCYDVESKKIEQPSISKMNVENKNSISLQNQIGSEYDGHDPQLQNLSPKQFLLGCVFLFVKVEIKQEDNNISNNTTVYKDQIIEYGGSVEQYYSSCTTHVICLTQKHRIVEKGIQDGKRCLTDYWLRDIILRKNMIPPWLPIHFPIPYRMDNLPCQHFQFSIVHFGTNEGHIIKEMIELVGGGHVIEKVTTKTDIVISRKLEGKLVEKALATNKPVVNVQWLNDILFGAKLGVKEPGHLKYQQFDLCNPFLVNYDMVTDLMEAWKTPLNISESHQQIYDLTLDPDSLTKCNRQKTTSKYIENQNMTNLINDDNDVTITCIKTLPLKPCVLFCGFSKDDYKILKEILLMFGGTVARQALDATHLVMNKPITSMKFFECISTVKYILNEHWLKDSNSGIRFLDEKHYFIQVIEDEFLGSFYVPAIFENNNRHKLFRGLSFFVTPGIIYPNSISLELIISSAGGTIERTRRSLESIRGLAPNTYFIISCQEDHYLYNDLLNSDNVVYLPAFITSSILVQKVQLKGFLLEVSAQN